MRDLAGTVMRKGFSRAIVSIFVLGCFAALANIGVVPVSAATGSFAERSSITGVNSLTPAAHEIADLMGISPLLVQLIAAQKVQSSDLTLVAVSNRQKLIYLREKINSLVQSANLQINSTRGKVETSVAHAEELRAYITERRNRLTHRNSQINLISGGITKIVGYSIALSPLSDIPTNALEVLDGSVQTALSGLALRQEKQEAALEHGTPPILQSFINATNTSEHYPEHVWKFMSSTELGEPRETSRRQQVIDGWQKSGMLAKEKTVGAQERTKRNVTIELLDQRLAMLSDLKSLISEMHNGLMDLNEAIVDSFEGDPQW
jgi:hypothetical protein